MIVFPVFVVYGHVANPCKYVLSMLRTRQKCVGIAQKLRGHDKVLITGVASEYSWKSTRDVEMENSRSSRFTAIPATVLCRLCSCTAGQQFTELYYYVIRIVLTCTEDILFPQKNLGNLSMRSQCIPGPLLWGTGDEASSTVERTAKHYWHSDRQFISCFTSVLSSRRLKYPFFSSGDGQQ